MILTPYDTPSGLNNTLLLIYKNITPSEFSTFTAKEF